MPEWITVRAKAFVGAIVAGAVPVIFSVVKSQFGVEVPNDWQVAITAAIVGIFVHQTTNSVPSK